MKRITRLLLTFLLMVPLMAAGNAANAMNLDEMQTIVSDSRAAVDQALAQLEAANAGGNLQAIQLAQNALDMAILNYDIASESLAKAQKGLVVNDSVMLACREIAAGVTNTCNLLEAGALGDAQVAYDATAARSADLPPQDTGGLPAGLADIQANIFSALAESSSIMAAGGRGTGDGLDVGTGTASPI